MEDLGNGQRLKHNKKQYVMSFPPATNQGVVGSSRARQIIKHLASPARLALAARPLRDYLSTELVSSVRDAQDRASATPIENQVRLLDQMANIGARVMAGHGMMSVAEEGFAIFGRYADRTQPWVRAA